MPQKDSRGERPSSADLLGVDWARDPCGPAKLRDELVALRDQATEISNLLTSCWESLESALPLQDLPRAVSYAGIFQEYFFDRPVDELRRNGEYEQSTRGVGQKLRDLDLLIANCSKGVAAFGKIVADYLESETITPSAFFDLLVRVNAIISSDKDNSASEVHKDCWIVGTPESRFLSLSYAEIASACLSERFGVRVGNLLRNRLEVQAGTQDLVDSAFPQDKQALEEAYLRWRRTDWSAVRDFIPGDTPNAAMGLVIGGISAERELLKRLGDTHDFSSHLEYLKIAEELGFQILLQKPIAPRGRSEMHDEVDMLYVLFEPGRGILFTFTTAYGDRIGSGALYFNWKPDSLDDLFEMGDGHLFADQVWIGARDCRAAFRTTIKWLDKNGDFVTPWVDRPSSLFDDEEPGDYQLPPNLVVSRWASHLPKSVMESISPPFDCIRLLKFHEFEPVLGSMGFEKISSANYEFDEVPGSILLYQLEEGQLLTIRVEERDGEMILLDASLSFGWLPDDQSTESFIFSSNTGDVRVDENGVFWVSNMDVRVGLRYMLAQLKEKGIIVSPWNTPPRISSDFIHVDMRSPTYESALLAALQEAINGLPEELQEKFALN